MARSKLTKLELEILLLAAGAVALAVPITPGMVKASSGSAQSQNDAPRQFEVASIKRNTSNERARRSINAIPASGRLVISAMTVKEVIQGAYRIQPFELMNADSPVLNERIDIEAKTERPVSSAAEMQRMLQPLLADRFKLVV